MSPEPSPSVIGMTVRRIVTVSHEDLRFVKTAISTMAGGLHASADVTNVQAGYNVAAAVEAHAAILNGDRRDPYPGGQ